MKTSKVGESIPFGFSLREEGWITGPAPCLRLPIMLWHRVRYEVSTDRDVPGWWALNLAVKKMPFVVKISWGWTLVRQTGEPIDRWGAA